MQKLVPQWLQRPVVEVQPCDSPTPPLAEVQACNAGDGGSGGDRRTLWLRSPGPTGSARDSPPSAQGLVTPLSWGRPALLGTRRGNLKQALARTQQAGEPSW